MTLPTQETNEQAAARLLDIVSSARFLVRIHHIAGIACFEPTEDYEKWRFFLVSSEREVAYYRSPDGSCLRRSIYIDLKHLPPNEWDEVIYDRLLTEIQGHYVRRMRYRTSAE